MQTDRLVEDYLHRLEAAAAKVLTRGRATELVGEIRSHIHDALQADGALDEAGVRNVLERIGPPEEIALAALDGSPSAPEGPAGFGALETCAVLVLGIGSLLFSVLATALGIALVWISNGWQTRDKLIATALPFTLGLFLPLLGMLAILLGGGGDLVGLLGSLETLILLGGAGGLAGLLGALYLTARLPAETPAQRKRRRGLQILLVIAGLGLIALAALGLLASNSYL